MLYGYARCSTDETRQNIDRQTRELRKIGVREENIFLEFVLRVQPNRRACVRRRAG